MCTVSRADWVHIYKNLQRVASKFPQYSYRNFARRRIRDHFEANKSVTDESKRTALYKEAQQNLELLKRQVQVSHQYPYRPLVIESKEL